LVTEKDKALMSDVNRPRDRIKESQKVGQQTN